MGYETSYQAIPADCGLIEMARDNAEVARDLALINIWLGRDNNRPAPGREDAHKGLLWNWCCDLAGKHPDLHMKHCYLDRYWDKLHYLLSATRRGETITPDDLAIDRAFNAGSLVSEHALAGQGVPVRYLTPLEVRAVAAVVGPMTHAALAAHFQPVRMEHSGVYKFHAAHADEHEWPWIIDFFDRFRDFFRNAAEEDLIVIIVRD
jgi:hypothetical protein